MGTPLPGSRRQPYIVVLDDDPSNAELTRIILELEGYAVATAESVDGALSVTTKATVAFILDFHLVGGGTGLTFLQAIRAGRTAADPDAAVVFVSGDIRGRELVLEAGADEFLMKPFTTGQLRSTLLHLLSRER